MPSGHARTYWRRSIAGEYLSELEPGALAPGEFHLLAENLPTPCWIARADGYIVWYNRRWHEYCGTTPTEMEGWGWQDVHDPDRLPDVMSRWQDSIATGEPFEMMFPLRGTDGVFRPFLTRIVPLRDPSGKVARWFGVNTEIGDQLRAEAALEESEAKFSVLTDAMPQMVWSTRPDGYHDFYNAQWYEFTGMPVGSTDGAAWSDMFHPDDRDRAWSIWRHSLASGEPYEVEYRLRRRDGAYRWTLGRALPVRDETGAVMRWIGTCTDIHDAKLAAEQNELLNRELSHRIKNIFAVISGLLSLAARTEPALKAAMRGVIGRVAALARAHDFARPHSDESRPTVADGELQGLLSELMRPYQNAAGDTERVTVRCDYVPVDDKGATPLALIFHELATNSAKYGALAVPEGRVSIVARERSDEVDFVWRELGGPAIASAPTQTGFGTRLTALSVEQQLGGTLVRHWHEDGLEVAISVKRAHLHRGTAAPGAGPATAGQAQG